MHLSSTVSANCQDINITFSSFSHIACSKTKRVISPLPQQSEAKEVIMSRKIWDENTNGHHIMVRLHIANFELSFQINCRSSSSRQSTNSGHPTQKLSKGPTTPHHTKQTLYKTLSEFVPMACTGKLLVVNTPELKTFSLFFLNLKKKLVGL
jgi:hypothetical protein